MDGQRPNSDLLGSEGSDEQESIDQDNQTGRSSQNVSFVGLPGNEDDVRKFVNDGKGEVKTYKVEEKDVTSSPADTALEYGDRGTYTSFGNEGTTASVNIYGQIMQISRFLGVGRCGFFSVDPPGLAEPCLIQWRAEELANLYGGSPVPLALYFDNESGGGYPVEVLDALKRPMHLDFVHDRWPRFTSRPSKNFEYFTITVQHFAHEGTVFERVRLETIEGAIQMFSKTKYWYMSPDWRIRELEFTDWNYEFNEEDFSKNYSHFLGPHGFSLVVIHEGTIPIDDEENAENDGSNSKNSVENDGEEQGARTEEKKGKKTIQVKIALIIAVCVNGQVCEFEKFESKREEKDEESGPILPRYRVKLLNDEDLSVEESKPIEVTTAFRLQVISEGMSWKDFLIPKTDFFSMDRTFESTLFTKLTFSDDPHVNFTTRRNLEHILSVCSIPVSRESEAKRNKSMQALAAPKVESSTLGDRSEKGTADGVEKKTSKGTALSCGDVSGHRIVTSASFFAFQFLLSMNKRLEQIIADAHETDHSTEIFAKNLQRRINATCSGHAVWLEHAGMVEGCFGANYWPNGRLIKPADEAALYVLAPPSLTDTPFQIIKLVELAFRSQEIKDNVKHVVSNIVRPWLDSLDQLNGRRFFAFPRPESKETKGNKVFRLGDHVWIWRALKSLEKLGLMDVSRRPTVTKVPLKGNLSKIDKYEGREEELLKRYSAAEFRRHVLRRFTTENNESKQRMLAVSRSASYNRFMFHAGDTALFYHENLEFFEKSDALWQATIDAQKFHKENQESESAWSNPLRYALALMMRSQNYQLNSRDPTDVWDTAKTLLEQISSDNGLFPGQVHSETKEPELFDPDWRDDYWRVGFEIPYIYNWYGSNTIQRAQGSSDTNLLRQIGLGNAEGVQSNGAKGRRESKDPTRMSPVDKFGYLRRMGTEKMDEEQERRDLGEALPTETPKKPHNIEMKKMMPFNKFIDQRNIVDVAEEWLYDEPDFLDFDPSLGKEMRNASRMLLNKSLDEFREYLIDPRRLESIDTQRHVFEGDGRMQTKRAIVMDVANPLRFDRTQGRKRSRRDPEDDPQCMTNGDLYKKLKTRRTLESAKKRLFWSPNADFYTAAICVLASTDPEKPLMLSFFERHFQKRKYFFDQVTPNANLWITEFHLSSYQLLEPKKSLETDVRFLGGEKALRRGCTGFRFVGDFFDRFWTCHILESESTEEHNDSEFLHHFDQLVQSRENLPMIDQGKKLWHQRKVLELFVFNRMLRRISRRYKEMFQEIGAHLGRQFPESRPAGTDSSDIVLVSSALFSTSLTNDTYLNLSKQWPPFIYTLQVMEEDLKETLEKISLWNNREKDRHPDRPRWTRNDESRYRAAITKSNASNNQTIRDLDHYLVQVQSLRTSLISRIEFTRNELSFQSAENVRFFTTVTVIFLPLGFATGTFSMSGAPNGTTLWQMVVMALGVFALTVVSLVNVRIMERVLFRPVAALCSISKMKKTFSRGWSRTRGIFVSKETETPKDNSKRRKKSDEGVDDSKLEEGRYENGKS